jgi:hypothetical protein
LLDNHRKTHEIFLFLRIPSLSAFGAAAGLGVCWITDWKAVLQYMPYYNGKFETTEEKK